MTVESNTRKIALLLSENADIGANELVEATGLTRNQVDNALEQLCARGVVRSIPRRYELTEKGAEELQRPNGFPPPGIPGTGRRRKRRVVAEVHLDANSVVGFARANRHPLDMAWRAAA